MATKDLSHNVLAVTALAPAAPIDNTAQVGAIIDTAGYESLMFLIQTGVLTTAAATFAASLAESDAADMSGSNAVAAADLTGALPAFDGTADNSVFKVGYIGAKRYVRLTITPSGNAAAANLAAIAVQGHARHAPVA